MKALRLLILILLFGSGASAQEKPEVKEKPKYDRREEIIYDGKRYRVHNSYLTLGPGFLSSTLRPSLQKSIGIDFQFPVRRLHFQAGVMMSGQDFGSNNNIGGHVCYGIRSEKSRNNLAAYIGPSFYTGVEGDANNKPKFYQGVGGYICFQAVAKLTYDIGIGAELFSEVSPKQTYVGLKFILFFSGAYRGAKKNFNPHVRSENPK